MKKKHIIAIVLGLLSLIGVLFHGSITECTKYYLYGPKPAAEAQKSEPKRITYTVKFTREVAE